ncbi:acyl carrier protein [bacterium]|nr:acyl carrier protein [bacterium]
MENEIFKKVVLIIQNSLQQQDLQLTEESSSKDVQGWDSLRHMMIIADIEKVFDIKIDFMEILNMKSVGDIYNVVNQNKK